MQHLQVDAPLPLKGLFHIVDAYNRMLADRIDLFFLLFKHCEVFYVLLVLLADLFLDRLDGSPELLLHFVNVLLDLVLEFFLEVVELDRDLVDALFKDS